MKSQPSAQQLSATSQPELCLKLTPEQLLNLSCLVKERGLDLSLKCDRLSPHEFEEMQDLQEISDVIDQELKDKGMYIV